MFFFPDKLKDDRDIVIAAISHNGFALAHASTKFIDDQTMIDMADQQRQIAKQRADEALKPKSLWDQEFFLELESDIPANGSSDWEF